MTALGALAFWAKLSVATAVLVAVAQSLARLGDRARDRIGRRYWRTLHLRTCDRCHHTWERLTREYDAALGARVETFSTCPPCRMVSSQPVEIDLDAISLADLRLALRSTNCPDVPGRDAAA